MRKLLLSALLILALTCLFVAFSQTDGIYEVGDTIEDFSVTVLDGSEVTLSELLREKDLVLINIWATWCGPCRSEFPYMVEAYEEYKDDVAIVALSCEPEDDMDTLRDFAELYAMTFFVGQDTPNLADAFGVTGIPTSIAVDRYGVICFIETGAMPDKASFERLFDTFLGDDYTDSRLLDGVPAQKPTVTGASAEELAAVLGEGLTFSTADEEFVWPMVTGEKDGKRVVVSSNAGVDESVCALQAVVNVNAGDALCVKFALSSEAGFDLMHISVDGEDVKAFGGEKDWMSYAYRFDTAGEHLVSIRYEKDVFDFGGADTLWLESVGIVSGAEAEAALAANPEYVFADETKIVLLNEGAKKLVYEDPSGLMEAYYGIDHYLCDSDEFTFEFFIAPDVDPELAFVVTDVDGEVYPLLSLLTDGRYLLSAPVDEMTVTGYPESSVYLYPTSETPILLTYYKNEENVNALLEQVLLLDGLEGSWHYEDGTLPSTNAVAAFAEQEPDSAQFFVLYLDQYGDPVPGAVLQVCNDTACQLFTADDEGVCLFELEPYPWELHTLMLPAGYTGDTETVTVSGMYGGEYVFEVTKTEE